jgi:2-polyprenyl-3-methyl-5-hydroxy-6-metoxy-1,4-benzoquinol methylase
VTSANAARDFSLHSGERQTAGTFAAVRGDHRARYEWAATIIGAVGATVSLLDLFCGTGYGTQYLANATGAAVLGLDASTEAIDFARATFPSPMVLWMTAEYPCAIPELAFDAITCFESLEHVEQDVALARDLAAALIPGGSLFVSVPNESVLPHATFRNPFHVRHYTAAALVDLFALVGLTLRSIHGQDRDGGFVPFEDGRARTLVAQFRAPTVAF